MGQADSTDIDSGQFTVSWLAALKALRFASSGVSGSVVVSRGLLFVAGHFFAEDLERAKKQSHHANRRQKKTGTRRPATIIGLPQVVVTKKNCRLCYLTISGQARVVIIKTEWN